MNNVKFSIIIAAFMILSISIFAVEPVESVLKPDDRIVFVGDSITGQGWNNADGFIHVIDNTLRQAYPGSTGVRIPLGGSGQSVSSWQGVEKGSREKPTFLDVKGFDAKVELDKPADVLIIMLGMNDILAPYVSDSVESQDTWVKQYKQLISQLRDRVKPRVIALSTITPYTENLVSPANRVRDALNRRIAILAEEEKCLLLPSGQRVSEILQYGRTLSPDFRITYDFVHSSKAGHLGIAMGMLDGLGEHALAKQLADKNLAQIFQQSLVKKPALSYRIEPIEGKFDAAVSTFRVRYWYNSEKTPEKLNVKLITPAGWITTENSLNTATGEFNVTGANYQFKTPLVLEAEDGDITTSVKLNIPAPWMVAFGTSCNAAFPGNQFNAATAVLPADEKLMNGEGFGQPVTITPTQSLTWRRYFSTPDYPGGDDPDSVSFLSFGFFQHFYVAYAARWIYSEKERNVKITPTTRAFAGNNSATVWLNAEQLYNGLLTRNPVDGKLKSGWNLLVFRSNHLTWQWQVTMTMKSADENDDMSDLRYSVQLLRPANKP